MKNFKNISNKTIAAKLRTMFDEKKVIKQYLAITKFVPSLKTGEIDIPLIRREVKGITKVLNNKK